MVMSECLFLFHLILVSNGLSLPSLPFGPSPGYHLSIILSITTSERPSMHVLSISRREIHQILMIPVRKKEMEEERISEESTREEMG